MSKVQKYSDTTVNLVDSHIDRWIFLPDEHSKTTVLTDVISNRTIILESSSSKTVALSCFWREMDLEHSFTVSSILQEGRSKLEDGIVNKDMRKK